MKSSQVLLLTTLMASSYSFAKCIPANEYVPFAGIAAKPNKDGVTVSLGTYSRISPDGKFVLRSLSGDNLTSVTLMEIQQTSSGKKEAIAHKTGLNNEAFPVQGSWRFLNDISGDHFRVLDILEKGTSASRQFRGGISGFYATAAEVPGGKDSAIQIRSLSWPNTEFQESPGQLKNRLITVQKNTDGSYKKVSESDENVMCDNLRKTDGNMYSLPMISTDGKEFAAFPQSPKNGPPSMRIYAFGENNEDCTLVDDLGVATSKAIFGYPQPGKKTPVVFYASSTMLGDEFCHDITSEEVPDPKDPKKTISVELNPPKHQCEFEKIPVNGIHVYDRDLKTTFFVGDRSHPVNSDSFPGMTKDGRVIYGATWQECRTPLDKDKKTVLDKDGNAVQNEQSYKVCDDKTGYVISDPYQSEDMKRFKTRHPELATNMKSCITTAEVQKAEAEQKAIYGLMPSTPEATDQKGTR